MSRKTRVVTALALVLSMLLTAFSAVREVSAGGPVTSNMLDKIYWSAGATETALGSGAIDLNDEPLSSTSITAWAGNPAITMDGYTALDKFQVDMNNQWWPTGPNDPAHTSPGPKNTFFNPSGVRDVAALHFRRAVAHLANKDRYATTFMGGYATVMETEVPVPALSGYTDYYTLVNATANADPWSPGMGGYIYAYSRAKAAQEFELGGFRDYDADTFREWRDPGADGTYGTEDDGPIEELPNMKFYELSRGPWTSIAPDLYNEMLSAGIPTASTADSNGLWYIKAGEDFCYNVITVTYNYNFLVGGSWALGADPDFIYNLYYSGMGQYAYALNYPGFKNYEFDSFAERVKYPQSLSDCKFAVVQAQWVKAKYVPVIELFASKGVKAYRTGWDDVVNMAGYGIDNRYSFLLMNQFGHNTIKYGLSLGPSDLHIMTSGASWAELPVPQTAWYKLFGAKVLSRIYDSLIGRNPFNLPDGVGYLATSWSAAPQDWDSDGKDETVVTFTLRDDAYFHDGSAVRASDVAFSLLAVRDAGSGKAWNYPVVMDIGKIQITGASASPFHAGTVKVYFKVESAFATRWAGFMPIINKDLWWQALSQAQYGGYTHNIPDDTNGFFGDYAYPPDGTGGYTDASLIRNYHPWESTAMGNTGAIDLTEDGSGPWVFTSYSIGNNVVFSSFASFYTTVYYMGQALPFKQFVNLAFHRIGDVNYPGSYGSNQVPPWYGSPPSASWIFGPSSTDGEWTNPTNAYTSDNQYTSSATDAAQHVYGGYGFDTSIPAGVTITKVEVGLEAYTTSSWGINAALSWDGGTTYYSFPQPNLLPTSDPNVVLWDDFTSATSWTAEKLSNANFKVKIRAQPRGGVAATVYLDWLPVRVTWKSSSVDIRIVKPDSSVTSLLNSIPISQITPWSYQSLSISPSIFSQSGTYQIQLVTNLATNTAGTDKYIQVNWDDVGLRLEEEPPAIPITNMNFTSDASSWTITQTGTGTPTSSWDGTDGNPSPGSDVGSLKLRATSTTEAGANLEFVVSQSFDWSSGMPSSAYFSYAFDSTGNSYLPYDVTRSPSTNTRIGWTNPTNAYTSNNYYATTNTNEAMRQYSIYSGTQYLTGYTIVSVELGIEAFSSVSSASLSVSVSWDGGTSWAPEISVGLSTTDPDNANWKDFTTATTWDPSKLSAANFRARVKAMFGGTLGTISLDWIPIRVGFLGAPAENPKIDLYDLTKIATSMPSTSSGTWGPGELQYNPDADIDQDGLVNAIDLAMAGSHYNQVMG